jgi:hypothetical protein
VSAERSDEQTVRAPASDDQPDSGWLLFASCMLAIGGGFNVIAGVVALRKPEFVRQDAVYAFSNLHTWGWIILGFGALELLSAFTLLTGSQFARYFGIVAALVNGVAQLLFIHSYPVLSLTIFGVAILVIWVLAVHGERRGPAPVMR